MSVIRFRPQGKDDKREKERKRGERRDGERGSQSMAMRKRRG
jgi:hypothetical protein